MGDFSSPKPRAHWLRSYTILFDYRFKFTLLPLNSHYNTESSLIFISILFFSHGMLFTIDVMVFQKGIILRISC